jgi:two-component system response regulator RegA
MLKENLEGERPSTNSPRDTSRGLTILIADPQVTADVALVRCLVCEGHHVLIARNFESAYRFSKFDHLDYAVTELRFSDGNGFDLVRALTVNNPRCRTIVHSAYCDLRVAVNAVKLGASDVCPRPMDPNHLIGILLEKCKNTSTQLQDLEPPDEVRAEHIRQVFSAVVRTCLERLNTSRSSAEPYSA